MALALAIAVTLMPVVGGFARAEADAAEKAAAVITDEAGSGTGIIPEDVVILDDIPLDDGEIALTEDASVDAAAVEAPVQVRANSAAPVFGGAYLSALSNARNSGIRPNATVKHTVKITQKGATVTIKGSVPSPYLLAVVMVDDAVVSDKIFGKSINYKINMNSGTFATGYHTVVVGIAQKDENGELNLVDVAYKYYVKANIITDKPTYKGRYEVYSTYFDIYPFEMSAFGLWAPRLYLEYSSDGGKTWMRSGYMKPGGIKVATEEGYTISGLQPDTTYKTRLRYGETVTYDYDGKDYVFFGPALSSYTITTGKPQAPRVKSIKVKATKIKYHKVKHYGYYTGVYLYTEKYYTCKIKVTVKLKRKPGAKGLWISLNEGFGHTKFVRGNKKKYTATFTPNVNYWSKKPNKSGTKYTVTVSSGQSKSWGGYSPSVSKKKKLK